MNFTKNGNQYDLTFDSALEMAEFIRDTQEDKGFISNFNKFSPEYGLNNYFLKSRENDFMGNADCYTLIDDIKSDKEVDYDSLDISSGLEIMNDDIFTPKTCRRRMVRGLDDGDEIDIDRYLEHNADCFESSIRTASKEEPFISLKVTNATSCMWEMRHFKNRERMLFTILKICEDLGINVEVTAERLIRRPWEKGGENLKISFLVKDAGTPLCPSTIAHVCGSIGFNRIGSLCPTSCVTYRYLNDGRHCVARGWGEPTSVTYKEDETPKNEYHINNYNPCGMCLDTAKAEVWRFVEFLKKSR